MQEAKQASTISKIALALAAALASIATASAIGQAERLPASYAPIQQRAAPSAPGGFTADPSCDFKCNSKAVSQSEFMPTDGCGMHTVCQVDQQRSEHPRVMSHTCRLMRIQQRLALPLWRASSPVRPRWVQRQNVQHCSSTQNGERVLTQQDTGMLTE